jgi:signal transduction histidine kinase
VLVTGRQDIITPRKGMEEGADDFLLKPVSLETLKSCVAARFRRADINWRVEDKTLAQLRASVPPQLPHELFVPMAGIIGLLEILRGDLPTFPSDEVGDIHNEIYKSALRIQRTLRNYLMVLELQKAAYAPTSAPLTPQEAKDSIRDGIHHALRLHDRKEDVDFQASPCELPVKAGDLSRLVEELVDNACKFSRRGTPVKVVLGADKRLIVSDEGRGLTPDEIDQIEALQQFEPKRHGQPGFGLGLVLVQKLADLSGARFLIRSQPGEGAQIEIVFPS